MVVGGLGVEVFEAMGAILQLMWNDRMDITVGETVSVRGVSRTVFPDVPQQQNVPCRANLLIEDPIDKTNPEAVEREIQVFCSPEVSVPVGSKLSIRRYRSNGTLLREYKGTRSETSDPNVYYGHQAIIVKLESFKR